MMAEGFNAASAVSTKASEAGSLRLETKIGTGAMPRLTQRFEKGVDGRDIGGEQHRTIEQDGDDGRAGGLKDRCG